MRLERLVCVCGNDCTFKLCKVRFLSRDVATGNVILATKTTITAWNDYMKSYYKFSNNEYRPMLINSGYDFCAAQEDLANSPLNNLIINAIKNHTNWNRKCPFPPGEYYVKNLNLQAKHMISMIPAGRYLMNISSYIQSNVWLYNISVYGSVANYGIQDMNIG